MALSAEDKAVLDLIEKANEQYENYLALSDVACLAAQPEAVVETEYNWDRPLALVVTADK
jgi:hypothetical protein